MKTHTKCEAQLEGCTYIASECHHANGRGKKFMLDSTTYRSLCSNCHHIVENSPTMAKLLNLSGNRLDKSA